MKQDHTFIAVVLDRSGSMSSVRADTIGGFNTFLRDQKAHPGEATLTLAQFDDQYEIVHDAKPLRDVPDLTDKTYVPRGSTALHDAIGRTIDSVGARLASMPESDRPARVIVLILTDGHENASKEYVGGRAAQMIAHQREKYAWEFVFMGANQDAALAAKSLNIAAQNAANYAATASGTRDAYGIMSNSLRSYRSGGSARVDGSGSK
jgi:uncharacterized protein YegL